MTQPRSSLLHPDIHRRAIYAGAAVRKSAATAAMAGRAAYREEFQPDHGPDLDESVDGTETGRELNVPSAGDPLQVLLKNCWFGEGSGSEQSLSDTLMLATDC